METKYKNKQAVIGMAITALLILLLSGCGKEEIEPAKPAIKRPEWPWFYEDRKEIKLFIKH